MNALNTLLFELKTAAGECEARVSAVVQRIAEVEVKFADAVALVARLREEAQALTLDQEDTANKWARIQADIEAVERAVFLVNLPVDAGDVVVAEADHETYGQALLEILGRNPDSTKEWAVAEIKLALSKRWDVAPSLKMEKNIRVNLDLMVKKNRLMKKDHASRGVVVYQLR
jgi:hypothetical protein